MSIVIKKGILPANYEPSDSEEYMNPMQLEFFRQKLVTWKQQLLRDSDDTLIHLKENELHQADISTRASAEEQTSFELRTRNRYRKLINKIDAALERIIDGTYGYCEESGDEIGVNRLKARPIATLSIEAQERHENYERLHNTDDLEIEEED
ncbi:MAG: RNA polymerase-binding protein DksA [Rickettsiaceae bacterium]|nr:RNA polymerase-binding protein DksA [Rickettsiaceae bacterium]